MAASPSSPTRAGWPGAPALRIGLGCMRMATSHERDEVAGRETIAAAVSAGVTLFDTAHAYGRDDRELGHSERLLAAALRHCDAHRTARVITKGGMTRPGGAWIPDGRAKAIVRDCQASLAALDGVAIDLYLIHAPDPRTPWPTSVRALARLLDEGLVRHIGLSNVNRHQLDEALELTSVSAVEVSVSVYDDRAVRGGILERCAELGIALIAHSPLGGPRRAARLARDEALARVAARHGATPAQVALAWLLDLSPVVVAIPGATRPETARAAAQAPKLSLDAEDRAAIHPAPTLGRSGASRAPRLGTGVVIVMGIPGAGKSRLAAEYTTQGYVRLNRDERGGMLLELAGALDDTLSTGAERVVLDNTYLTRAARSYVVEVAQQHGVPVRCLWLDTPLAQAQVNLVERMLQRFGALPAPDELRRLSRREPGLLLPTSQMRAVRELEPPSLEEGFAAVERVPFTRARRIDRPHAAVFVAAAALRSPGWEMTVQRGDLAAPHLVFDWKPGGTTEQLDSLVAALAGQVTGPVQAALCPHGAGPPRCWCRPPLPGLPLAFSYRQSTDPARSILIGAAAAHRTLAAGLGARYLGR